MLVGADGVCTEVEIIMWTPAADGEMPLLPAAAAAAVAADVVVGTKSGW